MSHLRRLFRTGHDALVQEQGQSIPPEAPEFAEVQLLRVRCFMEGGQFRKAAEAAGEGASYCGVESDRLALELIGAFADMMERADAARRARVRQKATALAASGSDFAAGLARKLAARLALLEVTLQVRPITDYRVVMQLLAEAREFYREADRMGESREELAMLAETAGKGPFADRAESRRLWELLREEAAEAKDEVDAAKASLALAAITLEASLEQEQPGLVDAAFRAFLPVAQSFEDADFATGDAEVQAVLGRLLLRFGEERGADFLERAAQVFTEARKISAADGAWRDLLLWYQDVGETERSEHAAAQLRALPRIESDLTAFTNGLTRAHAAYVRGDFAAAAAVVEETRQQAVTPGQEASLLLQMVSVLLGRGARPQAVAYAHEAVALLEPAAPCSLLGDALFHLGMALEDAEETPRLWREAAEMDLVCRLPEAAAMRLMNLGQWLAQPQDGQPAPTESAAAAEACYQRAVEILRPGRDRSTLLARGNLAQRRGQSAFLTGDLAGCAPYFTEAEHCFRLGKRNADLAFLLAQQGLVFFQIARGQQRSTLWQEARRRFDEARERFEKQQLFGEEFRMLRLSATSAWEGSASLPETERESWLCAADERFETGAARAEALRAGRRELELFARQDSRENFAREFEAFFEEGFRYFLRVRRRVDRAFLWLERIKARALLDAVAETDGALTPPPGAEAELVARERALLAQRRRLAERGLSTPGDSAFARTRWLETTRQLDALWEQMARRPETASYAALRRGHPVSWPEWRRMLTRESRRPEAMGRAVVSVHFAWPRHPRQEIELIVGRSDWDQPRSVSVPITRETLESFWRACFERGEHALATYLSGDKEDRLWSVRLAGLVEPLAEWIQPGDLVALIPQGTLHRLPLHSLKIAGRPFGERNAIFYAPSASILSFGWERELARSPSVETTRVAVLGCGEATAELAELPQARAEARFVAGLWGVDPLLDAEVTREALAAALREARTVHFSGHGEEAETGWGSALLLTGGTRMTALDLHQIPTRADLVTLSGCRTASNRWSEGDEALGLVPALLYAGAGSVLASHWSVGDGAAEALMRHFYGLLRDPAIRSKAEALRQAVTRLRGEFPMLIDWAAFCLHGDWK